jgi:hypothetical protein
LVLKKFAFLIDNDNYSIDVLLFNALFGLHEGEFIYNKGVLHALKLKVLRIYFVSQR